MPRSSPPARRPASAGPKRAARSPRRPRPPASPPDRRMPRRRTSRRHFASAPRALPAPRAPTHPAGMTNRRGKCREDTSTLSNTRSTRQGESAEITTTRSYWPSRPSMRSRVSASRRRHAVRRTHPTSASNESSGGAAFLVVAGDEGRRLVVLDDGLVDDALRDVGAAREVVHHLEQHLLQDRPQTAGTRASRERLVGDGLERVVGEVQVDVVELEELLVLPEQRVLRHREDLHQRVAVEVVHRTDDGEPADELGDEPELQQVLRHDTAENRADVALVGATDVRPEADALVALPPLDDLVDSGERSSADEEDVRGVDLDELLVRMLAPTLGRHRRRRPLEDLQQRLLHALARDVTRDRRVLGLAGDLVDLVDVDDPGLGLLDVVVRGLDQLQQDVLDVLADVPGLGERRRVRDRERDAQQPGERLREQRLAATGRAEEEDVRFLELDVGVAVRAGLHALVVVVDRDREDLLRLLLPDDVVVQVLVDLARLGQVVEADLGALRELLFDDLVAEVDALVADVDAWTRDELLDLLLALSAERALQQVATVSELGHVPSPWSWCLS